MSLAALVAQRPLRLGDKGSSVAALQLALRTHGAELVVDSDFGRITFEAVRRAQAAFGLAPDGVVGHETALALDRAPADPAANPTILPSVLGKAPWLSTMRAISGTKEIPGGADNPVIIQWGKDIGEAFPDLAAYARQLNRDAIPWCGHTEAYCFAVNGIKPVTKADGATYGYLWAEDWKHFGKRLDKPIVGCVMVLRLPGGCHVTMLEGETPDHWICRGGNQNDQVKVSSFGKKGCAVIAACWPLNFPVTLIPGMTGANVQASTSER